MIPLRVWMILLVWCFCMVVTDWQTDGTLSLSLMALLHDQLHILTWQHLIYAASKYEHAWGSEEEFFCMVMVLWVSSWVKKIELWHAKLFSSYYGKVLVSSAAASLIPNQGNPIMPIYIDRIGALWQECIGLDSEWVWTCFSIQTSSGFNSVLCLFPWEVMQCSAPMDILFLMDGSYSVGKGSFERSKHYAIKLCQALDIGPDKVCFFLVSFLFVSCGSILV